MGEIFFTLIVLYLDSANHPASFSQAWVQTDSCRGSIPWFVLNYLVHFYVVISWQYFLPQIKCISFAVRLFTIILFVYQAPRPMTMKKEIIQTRNRKMNKKLIVKAR